MTSNTAVMANYTEAIKNLPEQAYLGSLVFFSISAADVNLAQARETLENEGLDTGKMRKVLRPIDAFTKSSNRFKKKFAPMNGVRSELMVRPVGIDGEQAYRHLILERAVVEQGKKRRVFYEKVGELTFTRGRKVGGEYVGHSVECRRTTEHLGEALTMLENQWLTEQLATFEDNYDHLLHYMDSHAVRSFVREYIYALGGTCVKESGGLYFVAQEHVETIHKLAAWVESVGSEFHTLPLLNLADQREMILNAFEDETVAEIDRLMGEVQKILSDPDRKIEEKTFDAYANQAAALMGKVKEYNGMLDTRATRAETSVKMFTQQCSTLVGRIRESRSARAKI